jgi:hypothetical protein
VDHFLELGARVSLGDDIFVLFRLGHARS